jgi:DNA-binding HxlR family transcriptional regulator
LIRKVPKSYRYRLTDKGRTLVAALQAVRNASLERLGALAA